MLCTFGYDRNIRINVERLCYEEPCYDVHAENAEGDVYEQIDSEGLMFHIYEIIDYMTNHDRYIKFSEWGLVRPLATTLRVSDSGHKLA